MNHTIKGWKAFSNPRHFPKPYQRQKGWEREKQPDNESDNFQKVSIEQIEQLQLPKEWL